MSVNASIKEGGQSRSFTPVKLLMVRGEDGNFYPWFPESDRRLETLNANKNGTYKASDHGVYGWSTVFVNVAESDHITGKDPETGEEKTVTVDPETGELVETVVPVEIRITTLPTKTEYTHGEAIDYSGIVVHAYSATGQDMGAVPFNELVFPETTADVQKTDEWTDGQGLNAMMLYYTPHPNVIGDTEGIVYCSKVIGTYNGNQAAYGGTGPATILVTRYFTQNYAMSVAGSKEANLYANIPDDGSGMFYGWIGQGGSSQTLEENRFKRIDFGEYLTDIPVSTVAPTTVDPANLHATQSIPVQWQRPGDGAILETSFDITVTGGN